MAPNSNILAYQGNAALAGGYGPGGIPAGTGADSLNAFNNVMANIATQNAQINMENYRQKIKDRDDILKAVADNQIDFEVEDIYRPQLESQIEAIKKIRLQTPDIKSNPKEWDRLQTEINKFKEMSTLAKTNSAMLKSMKQEYANNPDKRYRETLGSHITGEMQKGISHLVQPYQKLQDFTDKIFYKPDEKSKNKVLGSVTVDENGITMKEITEGSDLNDWYQYYSPKNIVDGEYKNLPDEMAAFGRMAVNDKQFTSPKNLIAINSKLDAINKANNLQPGDPRYLPPIATDNGDGTWNIEKDPTYLAMASSLYSDYELPKKRREVDAPRMAAMVQNSTMRQNEFENKLKTAQASKLYSDINIDKQKLPYEIDKLKAEAEKYQREGQQDLSKAYGAAQRIVGLVEDLQGNNQYQDIPSADIAARLGVTPNAKFMEVPVTNKMARDLFSKPVYKKGKLDAVEYPAKVYMIRDGNDVKFAALRPGQAFAESEVLDIKEAPTKLIQSENKWNLSDMDNKAIGLSFDIMKEQFDGAAPAQQQQAPTSSNEIPFSPSLQTRQGGNGLEVNVNGSWRRVLGRNGNNVVLE